MKIFLRILLIISTTFIGLVIMANIAARFLVSKSDGLAGGAIVLGYGLLGALICLIAATVISLKLPLERLRIVAIGMGGVAFVFLMITIMNVKKTSNARLNPESAYDGLPHFTITVQQTKIIDPVLSRRHTINTPERKWTNTLPDGRICRGTLSAKAHKAISQPLLKVSNAGDATIKSCLQTAKDAQKELTWKFLTPVDGVPKGRMAISQICLEGHPDLAHLIREVSKANLSTTSSIKCK